MKYIIKNLFLVIAAIALLSNCSSDDPFKGSDTNIVSFNLTSNGIVYKGSISGNIITISAPKDIDLTHATVDYKLCEAASIQPDPAKIEDWNSEQVFRVQSLSGSYVGYKYTVDRSDRYNDGTVLLETQTDVDNFASKKVTHISGNLIIGSSSSEDVTDPIHNLDGLKTVTAVDYNVVVNKSFAGSDLSGLSNLKKANGFYIGDENNMTTLSKSVAVELPALEQLNNLIVNTDSITNLSIPKLTTTCTIFVNSTKLETLNLSSLALCYGNLTLTGMKSANNYQESNSNLALTSLNLNSLKEVYGILWIENFWKLPTLEMKTLEKVDGDLQVKYVRGATKILLPALTTVSGTTNIEANDGMTNFSAPKLTHTTSFYIGSYNLYSINLVKLDLSSLESVTTDMSILFAGANELSLPKLKTVGNTLKVNTCQFLNTLSLPELTNCKTMLIQSCGSLDGLNIDNAKDVLVLQFENCNSLSSVSAASLTYLDNLTLKYVPEFSKWSAPKLTVIKNTLLLYGATNAAKASTALRTHMNDFAPLTSVGSVDIRFFGNLSDFSGLKNTITGLTATNWNVLSCKYNPAYVDMVNGKYRTE